MNNRTKFNRNCLMASAATGLALLFSIPAYAQEADDTDTPVTVEDEEARLGTVTVSGIRGSITNSLNTKKNATSIVEAISAEDIGKLPDLSIADSLARLPGVTAQRVRGRAQQISIRGLGPDFSLALLNGREVVSAGNNRGIEFDQFPSELVAQGIVYKTPDAKLAATGIAGAVDLRTVRPLDFSDRRINLSGKYVVNDQDKLNPDFDKDGYRLFGSYIDQTADGTIGWSLGATVQSNPTQFVSRELKTNSGQTSIDPLTGLVYPSDNPRTGVVSREFERTSVAGSLQFEPHDRWSTTIDGFYTDTKDNGIFRGVETPIASWSGANFVSATGTSGFADVALYDAVVPILRTDTEGNTAEIYAFGLNTQFNATDRLSFTADISTSNLDRNDVDYESYAGTGRARSGPQDSLAYVTNTAGDYTIQNLLDYTDPSLVLLTDPGGWGQVGFIKRPEIRDELSQIRLEAGYDLGSEFISGIEGGILVTDREKDFDSNEAFLRPGPDFVDSSLAIPANAIIGATDGDFGLDIIAYDPSRLLNGVYTIEPGTFDTEWIVEEEIMTFYALANIDTVLANMPVRGNIGFQYVDTKQSSTGTLSGLGEQTVVEDYTNFLPSLNLSFEIADDTFVRAAAAKTLTRARLDQLAANQSISANVTACPDADADGTPDTAAGHNPPAVTCYNVDGGNPFLQPYQSTSLDLAFEKYFNATTAISLAVFHKELEDWIIDQTSLVDATQQIRAIGDGAFLDANPQVAAARLSGPTNFADGSITGIEATLRMNLDEFLPTRFEGFGFNASYTYADNSLDDDMGNEITIPGYSDTVWSGDVYYENYGWQARLSARHRSGFLSEVPQFDGALIGAQARDETVLDAQIGYEFETGPLEGFSFNFEAFNITDEPFVTENVTADPAVTFASRYENYGPTYNFTVAKKF